MHTSTQLEEMIGKTIESVALLPDSTLEIVCSAGGSNTEHTRFVITADDPASLHAFSGKKHLLLGTTLGKVSVAYDYMLGDDDEEIHVVFVTLDNDRRDWWTCYWRGTSTISIRASKCTSSRI